MTEVEELKAQLVAVRVMSNAVEQTTNWQDRRHALEDMQREIQRSEILIHYAADLMVQNDECPPQP
jgi:hypothetical protein